MKRGLRAPPRGRVPLAAALGRQPLEPEGARGPPRRGDRPERPDDVVLAGSSTTRPSRWPATPTRRCRASGRSTSTGTSGRALIQPIGWSYEQRGDSRAPPRRPGRLRLPRQVVAVGRQRGGTRRWESPRDGDARRAELPVEPERHLRRRHFRSRTGAAGASSRPAVLWPSGVEAYARQDFFAYVARRWNGGSLRDLRWLFQHLPTRRKVVRHRAWRTGRSTERPWTSTTRAPSGLLARAVRRVRRDGPTGTTRPRSSRGGFQPEEELSRPRRSSRRAHVRSR